MQAHLRPGGLFAMYNQYREPWLVDRYAATVAQAFGHRPYIDLFGGGSNAVIVAAADPAQQRCDAPAPGAQPVLSAMLARGDTSTAPVPVTDDRPFPYLRTPSVPFRYLFLVISVVAVRVVGTSPGRLRPYTDLAFTPRVSRSRNAAPRTAAPAGPAHLLRAAGCFARRDRVGADELAAVLYLGAFITSRDRTAVSVA